MGKHQPLIATPVYSTSDDKRAEILTTYDDVVRAAKPHMPFGEPDKANLHALRRRVASTCGVSVEQVSDAIARRDMQQREIRAAAARPRHSITRGIE